jgi:hypothetical protein
MPNNVVPNIDLVTEKESATDRESWTRIKCYRYTNDLS